MISKKNKWLPGNAPVAVLMITLNEGHNLEGALKSISGWAKEVFILDSCSSDNTIDVALKYGAHVVQRDFTGFGDQWNFAVNNFPITSEWVMKLDPDERLSDELKISILELIDRKDTFEGIIVKCRLWFINKSLPAVYNILRVWKTGSCNFSGVSVNEYPKVDGLQVEATGYLEHRDSPNLHHWITKQNRYTTAEAISQSENAEMSYTAKLLGNNLERRMWIKKYFWYFPMRYQFLFLYHLVVCGAWKVGKTGWIWSHMRTEIYRQWEYKSYEISETGKLPIELPSQKGLPDSRVKYFSNNT